MEKGKGNHIRIILITFVVLISTILVICGVYLYTHRQTNSSSNIVNQCNSNNYGKIACSEDRIYYVNCYDASQSDTCLYSTNLSGVDKKLISESNKICDIHVVEEYIYYTKVDYEKLELTIGRMNKDGTGDCFLKTLKLDKDDFFLNYFTPNYAYKMEVSKDNIYILYNKTLTMCDTEGNDEVVINDDIVDFTVSRDYVYYGTKDGIYSYKLKNAKIEQIHNTIVSEHSMTYEDGMLYYVDDTGLYYLSIKSKDKGVINLVSSENIGKYIFYGEYLYYIKEFDEMELSLYADTVVNGFMSHKETLDALSVSEKTLIAKVLFDDAGNVYKVSRSGGKPEMVDFQGKFAVALFSTPTGVYYKALKINTDVKCMDEK